ncbi:MAG: MraY family glycosyltransferase [Thermoprotei archaeon]
MVNEISAILLPIVSFAITFLLTPLIMKIMKRIGKTGVDVHKLNKPEIPELGGISIIIGVSLSVIVMYILNGSTIIIASLLAALIAGIIGLLDDLFDLGGILKPALTIFAFLPIYIMGVYYPRPALPFIPGTRLFIIYQLLLPFSITVPANAVNMLDVINGATPLTTIPVFIALAVSGILLGGRGIETVSLIAIASLIAFYYYNKYPAKTFMGNSGDFFVGGLIGALAVTGRLEIVGIVALMPHIMNSFYILSSIRRLSEHKTIKDKPTRLRDDGLLEATDNPKAAISLLRLLLMRGPEHEKELARSLFILSLQSCILAIITAYLTTVRLWGG